MVPLYCILRAKSKKSDKEKSKPALISELAHIFGYIIVILRFEIYMLMSYSSWQNKIHIDMNFVMSK